MSAPAPSPEQWLEAFAEAVRARDLDAGAALFAPDAVAYGTRVTVAHNRHELMEHQWRPIWHSTSGFSFEPQSVHPMSSDDASTVVVAAQWTSEGDGPDGAFRRSGRCTIVLRRSAGEHAGYLAVHSHFSEPPQGDDLAS